MWILRLSFAITTGIVGAVIGFVVGLIWAGITMEFGVFDWEIVRNCTIVVALIAAIGGASSAGENTGEVGEINHKHKASAADPDGERIVNDAIKAHYNKSDIAQEVIDSSKELQKNMRKRKTSSKSSGGGSVATKEHSILLEKMKFFNNLTPVYNYFLSLEDENWLKPNEYEGFIQQFDTLTEALKELQDMLPTGDDNFNSVVDKFVDLMLDVTETRKRRWQKLSEKAHGGNYSLSEDRGYLRQIKEKLIMLDEQGKKVGHEQDLIAKAMK